MKPKKYIGDLFFSTRFFILWGVLVLLLVASFFLPELKVVIQTYFGLLTLFCVFDYALLFFTSHTILAQRNIDKRLSNGDDNLVQIKMESSFRISLSTILIDELPEQFQERNFSKKFTFKPNENQTFEYVLAPKERGVYDFGNIHLYATTLLNLVQRRCTSLQNEQVKVYPSFLQLRKHTIQATTDARAKVGTNYLSKRGMSAEFDHIKEYNRGDDARTINWKASARRNSLMVNSFMDEKSKQVYCIIDKGRLMKMPFNGLTLLDYSINASLMFSYTALHKDDKVGIVTFSEKADDFLQATKTKKQFSAINELLYKQQTKFMESNYAAVYDVINHRAGQRSLLMLFTNFETLQGFLRQLPYLQMLSKKHLLCVVMFENIELKNIHERRGDNLEDIYIKTIADKFHVEKKRIMREMQKNGILVIYTSPKELSIQVVNKYLELKRRQGI
jgi:uncharacterized protein (DUF58 family)